MPRFDVRFYVSGSGSIIVEAENEAEAQKMVDAKLDEDDFDPPIDDYGDVSITSVLELKTKQSK